MGNAMLLCRRRGPSARPARNGLRCWREPRRRFRAVVRTLPGGGRMSSVCSRSEAAFAAAGSGPRPPRSAAVPDRRPCSAPAGQPVPERSPAFGTWPPPMARCRPRRTQAPRGPLPGRRQAWRGRRGRSQWSRAETRLPSLESLSSGGLREPGRETPSPTRSSRTGPRSRRFPSRDRSWGRGTARRCWRAASRRHAFDRETPALEACYGNGGCRAGKARQPEVFGPRPGGQLPAAGLATPQVPSSRTSAAPKLPRIDRFRAVASSWSPSWRYQIPAASRLAGGP